MLLPVVIAKVMCWDNIPEVPTNRRSQFYLRNDDGAYNYGYDSGDGIAARQISTSDNQVEGFYSFTNVDGKAVNVKYTSGVQGFRPQTSNANDREKQPRVYSDDQKDSWSSHNSPSSQPNQHLQSTQVPHQQLSPPLDFLRNNENSNSNSDASYKISYNTGDHAREENSDSAGNVQGKYSYVDEAGQHDLSYIAGPNIGFKVVGGSLSIPNGLANEAVTSRTSAHQSLSLKPRQQIESQTLWKSSTVPDAPQQGLALSDGSYSFSYNTGDHARSESSDASGNVQGKYSYNDEAGHHDLSYVAGGDSGFVVTGGSLSQSSGLNDKIAAVQTHRSSWSQAPIQVQKPSNFNRATQPLSNQAYSFAYQSDGQSRQESGDSSGHVKGSYSVQTNGGHQQVNFDRGFGDNNGGQASINSDSLNNNRQSQFPGQWSDSENVDEFNLRDKSVHPSYTLITPAGNQKSFEYGSQNAIILSYLPPQHSKKHGYIYDTQH